MSTRRSFVAALLSLLGITGMGEAQSLPQVDPGEVSTVTITTPRSATAQDEVPSTYTIEPAPDVRIFGERRGTPLPLDDQTLVIPITFTLPRQHPSGAFVAAHVTVQGPDSAQVIPLEVEVRRVRNIELVLDAPAEGVVPGGTARLRYQVANRGNALDTVRLSVAASDDWAIRSKLPEAILARGDTITGTLELMVPRSASIGRLHPVWLSTGEGSERAGVHTQLRVVASTSRRTQASTLPVSLFMGGSTADGVSGAGSIPALALTGRGRIGTETDVSITLRHSPDLAAPAIFRNEVLGPRLQVGIRRPGWNATAGEIGLVSDGLLRTYVQGHGLTARWGQGSTSGGVFLARTPQQSGSMAAGHLARAEVGTDTRVGTLSLIVADWEADRPASVSSGRAQTAGLRYDVAPSHDQQLSATLGLLRSGTANSPLESGPAADARYTRSGERSTLQARLRWLAAPSLATDGAGNEAYLGGSAAIARGVRLTGTGYTYESVSPVLRTVTRTGGGALGLQLDVAGARVGLTGQYRASSGDQVRVARELSRQSIIADLSVPLGPFSLDSRAELGRGDVGIGDATFASYRTGAFWTGRSSWGSLVASHHSSGLGPTYSRLDLLGRASLGALSLEGGAGIGHDHTVGRALPSNFWSGASYTLRHDMDLVVGTEHRARWSDESPWRFSVGFRKRLAVPVPSTPTISGVVFEDRDGDLEQGPGEEGLAGITVRVGTARAVTDEHGTFAIYGPVTDLSSLTVDASALGPGAMVPPDARISTRGRVAIPVVRTASLTLSFTRDGEIGEQDNLAGIGVALIDGQGRERAALSDKEGVARFTGLVPGRYTLTVHAPAGTLRAPPSEREIVLQPAERMELSLPAPTGRRIRMMGETID